MGPSWTWLLHLQGRGGSALCPMGSLTPAPCGCCVSILSSLVLASFVEGGGPSFL